MEFELHYLMVPPPPPPPPQDSFQQLNESLELAQRVSPTAMRAVVGTKADLHGKRKISSMDAVVCTQLGSSKLHPP